MYIVWVLGDQMNIKNIAIIILTLGLISHVQANEYDVTEVSKLMASYEQLGRFNGAITIKKDDKIIYSRGYGSANVKTEVNNDSDKVFAIGSISKQFTASAILLLAQQGKLSLADPIATYLPYYQNEVGQKATIYQLLTHTAGIPDPMDTGKGIDGDNDPLMHEKTLPVTKKSLIDSFKDLPNSFEPGSRYEYTNTGYILLADIIERASGKTYADYLKTYLFEPAGMKNTSASRPDNSPLLVESYSGIGSDKVHTTKIDNSWLVGAASLYSTTGDLFKWVDAMNAHKIFKDKKFDYLLSNPVDLRRNNEFYGYGMEMTTLWGQKAYRHDGATAGTVADFIYLPEQNIIIIIYMNHVHNVSNIDLSIDMRKKIIQQVSGILLAHKTPDIVSLVSNNTIDLQQYVGRYAFDDDHQIAITLKDNTLKINTIGLKNWTLYNLAQVTHLPPDQFTDTATKLFNLLNTNELTKLAEIFDEQMASAPLDVFQGFWQQLEAELGALESHYSFSKSNDNDEIQQRLIFEKGIVDMSVFFDKDGKIKGIQNSSPIPKEDNGFTSKLLSIEGDKLLIDGYVIKQQQDLILKFTRNNKNQITGFSYNQMVEHQAIKQ